MRLPFPSLLALQATLVAARTTSKDYGYEYDGGVIIHGSDRVTCSCPAEYGLAQCANYASDLWMQGEMDQAMMCMDHAILNLQGSKESRDAAKQNLQALYGLRLRTDSMRYYHGVGAKDDWIFPPLGTSKGFKDRSIRFYENALSPEFCDFLVRQFEKDTHLQYPGNILGKGVSKGKKNMEIDISDPAKGPWADIDWQLAQKTTKYLNLYEMERSNRNLANTGALGDEGFRMKRYLNISESKGGKEFHTWHSDGGSGSSCFRALAVVFYLNDVDEGGETVFLTEGINIKPKKGGCLIWPTGFNYVHAGLPPISGPKYIITNFLRYTAPRIFNVLEDVPQPSSLSDLPIPKQVIDASRITDAAGNPKSSTASSRSSSSSSPKETLSASNEGEMKEIGKRKRRRRRRRRRKQTEQCEDGVCEL